MTAELEQDICFAGSRESPAWLRTEILTSHALRAGRQQTDRASG